MSTPEKKTLACLNLNLMVLEDVNGLNWLLLQQENLLMLTAVLL